MVSDVDMPGMSGLELRAALALTGSALPVIVMSVSCDPAVEARALAGGAAGSVVKHFDADQLHAVVTHALHKAEIECSVRHYVEHKAASSAGRMRLSSWLRQA